MDVTTLFNELSQLDSEALDMEEELHLAYLSGVSVESIAERRLQRLQERIYGPGENGNETLGRSGGGDAVAHVENAREQLPQPETIP